MPFQTLDYERADLRARLAALTLEVKLLRWAHVLKRTRHQPSVLWRRKDRDGDVEGRGETDDGPGRVQGSVQYAQSGDFPRNHNNPPEPLDDSRDKPPHERDIPEDKPTQPGALSAVLRFISERIIVLGVLTTSTHWIARYVPDIIANTDGPKTFDELTSNVGSYVPGYQDHHIVEQTSAARDGFSREMINSTENVVKIPTLKHREITA